MKYTNKLNLPDVFTNYFKDNVKEPIKHRYSVTELLSPTQEIKLNREHYEDLIQDMTESIPALIGTSVHEWLEQHNKHEGDICETKFELKIGEDTLAGIIDCLNFDEQIIKDYKTCSTSKIIKQDFNDWYKQGMMYVYAITELYNVKIKKVQFLAIMKDWSKLKALNSASYPQNPIFIYEFEPKDSDFIKIEEFIKGKLKELNSDNEFRCSDEERWYEGDTYAVYKNESDKKATKLCNSEEEANGYIQNKLDGKGIIKFKKGKNIKCEYYCPVKDYCKQYKEENQ